MHPGIAIEQEMQVPFNATFVLEQDVQLLIFVQRTQSSMYKWHSRHKLELFRAYPYWQLTHLSLFSQL